MRTKIRYSSRSDTADDHSGAPLRLFPHVIGLSQVLEPHRVQRFTPLFADAARPLRHVTGDRWFVDET
jgi:hypothetical protein